MILFTGDVGPNSRETNIANIAKININGFGR